MTSTASGNRTSERLLRCARRLFLERPYADVTMDQIAAAASVTKGALYHHYASKEDLYLAMMAFDLGQKRALFEQAVHAKGDCRQRLRRLTGDFLHLPEIERHTILLVRRDSKVFQGEARARLVRCYQQALPLQVQSILEQGMNAGELWPGDVRLLSWQFIALVETMLTPYADKVIPDVEDRLDHLIRLFFEGAAAPAGGATQ